MGEGDTSVSEDVLVALFYTLVDGVLNVALVNAVLNVALVIDVLNVALVNGVVVFFQNSIF